MATFKANLSFLRELFALKEVMDAGQIQGAARRNGIKQSNLSKIISDLEFIIYHMESVDIEQLSKNDILLDSMLFRMIQISENAKNLTEDYKNSNPNIPWNAISGLRNRIVHDYGNVDLNVVFDTLKNDIPELLDILKN